ncbi:MAG: hypothetical protein QM679_02875 [Patulibacter sp.]
MTVTDDQFAALVARRRQTGWCILMTAGGIQVMARFLAPAQITRERAGGWQSVQRPGLTPVSAWDGPQALGVQLTLRLQATPPSDVRQMLSNLRLMGRATETGQPPVVRVAAALPDPAQNTPFILAGLTVEELQHTTDGHCWQANATVDLDEYVAPVAVSRPLRATSATVSYTWRSGDTLSRVARERLGDSRRAQWIRDANPKISRWSTVRKGTRIKLPKGAT